MDEYLYAPSGKYIPDQLAQLEEQHSVGTVWLLSQNLQMHFCTLDNLVIEQTKWI